ncbi:sugar transferase [Pseudomonadota bacterium]
MLNNLAPIGLSVYARSQHLHKAIEALKKNSLALHSELYAFSDAPRPGDERKVEAVRSYLRTIDGFRKVHIIEREKNDRVANSRGGLKMLLDRFGKVIFLAEDIVTAPGFLTFMNEALNKYERNSDIFNISGYCPPIKIPTDYQHDIFTLRRISAWGFGIWKNRFDQIRYMTVDEFEEFANDKRKVQNFVEAGGRDLLVMLKSDAYGVIDAGDVKLMYAQFLSDQYTIYPTMSLVQNIGHDGTGVHCGETDRFKVTLSDKTTFVLPHKPVIDPRIVKANRKFRNGNKLKKVHSRVTGRARRLIKKLVD